MASTSNADSNSSAGLSVSEDQESHDSGEYVSSPDVPSKSPNPAHFSRPDPTNIEALDDSARDTLIGPPPSVHDDLDFGDNEKEEGEEDEDGDGEVIENEDEDEKEEGEEEDDGEEGEIGDDPSPPQNLDLEDGEVDDDAPRSRPRRRERERENPAEDLEEGEVSDDQETGGHPTNKNKMPVCRFFGKGQCTWGSNCRFLHPGVIDKGLYAMFDGMRPLPPAPSVQPPPLFKPGLLGHAPINFPPVAPIQIQKVEEIVEESEWERAQRHAKEVIWLRVWKTN
jgi:nuclear protein NHN1